MIQVFQIRFKQAFTNTLAYAPVFSDAEIDCIVDQAACLFSDALTTITEFALVG